MKKFFTLFLCVILWNVTVAQIPNSLQPLLGGTSSVGIGIQHEGKIVTGMVDQFAASWKTAQLPDIYDPGSGTAVNVDGRVSGIKISLTSTLGGNISHQAGYWLNNSFVILPQLSNSVQGTTIFDTYTYCQSGDLFGGSTDFFQNVKRACYWDLNNPSLILLDAPVTMHSEVLTTSQKIGGGYVRDLAINFPQPVMWDYSTLQMKWMEVPVPNIPYGVVKAISADGTKAAGAGSNVPVIWDLTMNGTVQKIPLPAGNDIGFATGISDNGIVVGMMNNILYTNVLPDIPFVFVPGQGTFTFDEYCIKYNIDKTDWIVKDITGISKDGKVLVGNGSHPLHGTVRGWTCLVNAGTTPVFDLLQNQLKIQLSNQKLNIKNIAQLNSIIQINLTDIKGAVLWKFNDNLASGLEVDYQLPNVSVGTYFISIESEGKKQTIKYIKNIE